MEKENKKLAYCSAEKLELDLSSCWINKEIGHDSKKSPIKTYIISKSSDVKIENKIGDFFKNYNILAYGFNNESLNIDLVFLLNGYACLCRAETITNTEKDITISLVVNQKPRNLMQQLKDAEIEVEKIRQGIYLFQYMFNFQIVILAELPKREKSWLKILTNN